MCQEAHALTCAHFCHVSVRNHVTSTLLLTAPLRNTLKTEKTQTNQPNNSHKREGSVQHHLTVLLRDGQKGGGKLFFQCCQVWPKQCETAKIASAAASPLALTAEGQRHHRARLAALTPCQHRHLHVPSLAKQPQDVSAFLPDLANVTDVYAGTDTLCGSGVRAPLAQTPQRRLGGI